MVKVTPEELAACEAAATLEKAEEDYANCLLAIHKIDDRVLEDCRQFLTRPSPVRDREQLLQIVQELIWAVEELQFRRLQERANAQTGNGKV